LANRGVLPDDEPQACRMLCGMRLAVRRRIRRFSGPGDIALAADLARAIGCRSRFL
jgi:hypothetical protein